MDRRIISVAVFFGMTAVVLGAFGAHLLKEKLSVTELATFETGVRYQMYHALFLLIVGISDIFRHKIKKAVLILITIGIVLFSGSIYLLATNGLTEFDFKRIGFITPVGGLLLIMAWLLPFIEFIRKKDIK